MESILAMALEYTLKYWLKSFSRDQFKLQGRTFQLSNLDINGDALHASVGLPPAINVAQAKVGKLEIVLPSVSNVQTEPIAVLIDKLDLVLEETTESDSGRTSGSAQSSTSSGKASGYGFADKIADGMSLEVGIVNLMLETRGGVGRQGSATWASPLAAITIYNLFLYTTNENWQVVNLKEARDFSSNKKCIYVFKKLQWESLSVDLLPHPDMFTDEHLTCSENGINRRDDDGAKRLFFGGERFLDGISGEAYITVQRTEQNNPLGLEVQLHVTEAVCPALSEPGLRALLRFMTGLYVCLNRGDVDPKAQQRGTEAAGRSLVSIVVDHIFLCIKDVEFQLELLMQSVYFSRASISDGEHTKNISRVMVGGLFLSMLCDHWSQPISWLEALQFVALKWDAFSHPPCTLAQPSMQNVPKESQQIPCFGENLWPKIYPLGEQRWQLHEGVPLISLYSLQIKPSPAPPSFASQTVINCQPLMINLQEESCLRIASFLADGIVVTPGAVSPDFSVNSLVFTLKEFDLTVPLDTRKSDLFASFGNTPFQRSFSGARLHVEDLFFSQSPTIIFRLLNLHKDPACFCLWEDQPVDSSQGKWTTSASHISLSLETCSNLMEQKKLLDWSVGLWKCVELHDACFEAAMSTADGKPLITMPPPGGVVRIGVACQKYLSNTSVEQLFFVLDLYAYLGRVGEEIAKVGKSKRQASRGKSLGGGLMEKVPSDTAVSLAVNSIQLKFLESSLVNIQGMPLAQFGGEDLFIKVSHRTLGGAVAVSSSLRWESVQVDCVDAEGVLSHGNGIEWDGEHGLLVFGDECSQMRTIFWINNGSTVPFLEISTVHVIPYEAQDIECHSLSVSAKIAGVRLGGGMNYTEALLHRFGILGPDGGPGEGLSKGLKNLSDGPLSKLLRASPPIEVDQEEMAADGNFHDGGGDGYMELGKPDNVEITIQLKDWLFALEGTQEMAEGMQSYDKNINREERCWHTTFQSLLVKAKSTPKHLVNGTKSASNTQMYPVELVTVSVEGLQALMPQSRNHILQAGVSPRGINQSNSDIRRINGTTGNCGGINLEVCMVISEDDKSIETAKWVVENLKFSVKQPIEAVATKEELEYVALLCRSEVDSMGRITAGILRVFKLEKSIGQGTIDQLSNLGSESLDKIFSPEKLSRRSSMGSFGYSPSPNPTNERNFGLSPSTNPTTESPSRGFESTVASLEVMVSDSQAMCKTLVTELSEPGFSEQHAADIKQLNQKLEKMQFLLTRLRTQI